MVSINELLDWDPAGLGEAADSLTITRRALVDLQDEIDGGRPPSSWIAGSASAAHREHERLRTRLLDLTAEVADVAVNLDDAQARILTAKNALQDALSDASIEGFVVNRASGSVSDPGTYEDVVERDLAARRLRSIVADIDAALMRAQEADADLAAAMTSAARGRTDGGTGSLADAATQLPESMDEMTDAELAEMLGDDVAIHTITAFLDLELELATWELEGYAEGEYRVAANGTTFLRLHLEAGLGREIEVSGVEMDVSGGATTELELRFDSPEEARAFLDQLDDRALEGIGMGEVITGTVPHAVAVNVADYVAQQDISSFRVGAYGSGELEFDQPWARGAFEGRLDAYYDTRGDFFGARAEVSAEAEMGREGSGYSGAGSLAGEFQVNRDGSFRQMTLSGEMSASAANDRLDLPMPRGSSTGVGVDVQVMIDSRNPAIDEITAALGDGDMGRARELALDNGELTIRQTVTEQIASQEHTIDVGIGGVELEMGATSETATTVWHREAGRSQLYVVDVADLTRND